MTRRPRRKPGQDPPRIRVDQVGALVHCDVFGPTRVPSISSGSRYFITFIDDYSRRAFIYFLSERKFVERALQEFIKDFAAAGRGVRAMYYMFENYVPFVSRIRS